METAEGLQLLLSSDWTSAAMAFSDLPPGSTSVTLGRMRGLSCCLRGVGPVLDGSCLLHLGCYCYYLLNLNFPGGFVPEGVSRAESWSGSFGLMFWRPVFFSLGVFLLYLAFAVLL